MYILPRSTRRMSFLLIDDELAAFAGAFGAAEVVHEDIFVWKRNAIQVENGELQYGYRPGGEVSFCWK